MGTFEKYLQLAKNIDNNPVGAPNSKEFMQMLEIMYPKGKMLDLALLLNFKNTSVEEIAEKAGMSVEEISPILEEMAARGTILSKKSGDTRKYRLWPIYAGFFEYTTMTSKLDKDTHKKLNDLWHQYYKKTLLHEIGETSPPWKRVLPAEGALFMQPDEILPYETASHLIKTQADVIAVGVCACREIEKKCDKPVETCLAFGEAAKFMIEYDLGRELTIDEAIEVLDNSEKAGLVHMSSNNKNNLLFMCNCCPDCCHLFKPYTEFNYPDTVAKSSVRAQVSGSTCTGCRICVDKRCPVPDAITMVDGKAVVNEERCIGCGLCASACPVNAIKMTTWGPLPEMPETLGELSMQIWNNKKENRKDPNYVR